MPRPRAPASNKRNDRDRVRQEQRGWGAWLWRVAVAQTSKVATAVRPCAAAAYLALLDCPLALQNGLLVLVHDSRRLFDELTVPGGDGAVVVAAGVEVSQHGLR